MICLQVRDSERGVGRGRSPVVVDESVSAEDVGGDDHAGADSVSVTVGGL